MHQLIQMLISDQGHSNNCLSQNFCYILLTWGTIRWLRRLLSSSWRWPITLDYEMPNSPDTLRILLAGFTSMAWSTISESTVWDLSWSSKFRQPAQNSFNYLVTVLGSTASSAFSSQMFLIAFVALRLSSNLQSISSPIRLHCTFICVAFKSHTKWSNARRVSTPANTILPTIGGSSHCLNYFGHVIYVFAN